MVEVIVDHFQPETLKLMTGLKLPVIPEQAPKVRSSGLLAARASSGAGSTPAR
jgi:hypothetical protein